MTPHGGRVFVHHQKTCAHKQKMSQRPKEQNSRKCSFVVNSSWALSKQVSKDLHLYKKKPSPSPSPNVTSLLVLKMGPARLPLSLYPPYSRLILARTKFKPSSLSQLVNLPSRRPRSAKYSESTWVSRSW